MRALSELSPWWFESTRAHWGRNRGALLKPCRSLSTRPRQPAGELRARLDAELAEHLVEVVLDSARADEQSSCDLSVRLPLGGKARDLRLLRGELVERVHGPFAGALACRQQLAFGAAANASAPC